MPDGFEPAVDFARSVATRLVTESLSPDHCQVFLHDALGDARAWTAYLPVEVQPLAGRWIDKWAATLNTPEAGALLSQWLLARAMTFLAPP